MKKLISSISGVAVSVFAFLAFLMPAYVEVIGKGTIVERSESISAFNFISFEGNPLMELASKDYTTMQIVFSVIAIIFFIVAGILAVVSILNLFLDSKKFNLGFIQGMLAIVLSILAVALLVMVMAYVMTYNNNIGGDNWFYSIGIGMILIPIVTLIGTAFMVMLNGKKK